jgi:hypothetical protein
VGSVIRIEDSVFGARFGGQRRLMVLSQFTRWAGAIRSLASPEGNKLGSSAGPPANLFLLTHKCGNNYVRSVFRDEPTFIQYQTDELRGQMPGPYIGEADVPPMEFANIRCRNFSALSLEKSLRLIDLKRSRFFLFVRHPASFFRSAASYHLRGSEKWATRTHYAYLGNKTLTQALQEAPDQETRLILTMRHFGLLWSFPSQWVAAYHFLLGLDADVTIVKTEELFSEGDETYFESLAEKFSHDGFAISPRELMAASPRFMEKLPEHSTGEFKRPPLDGYTGRALKMYNDFFLSQQEFFYGSASPRQADES